MKFSEFKRVNEISKGKITTIDYTLFEMDLVRIIIQIINNEDGGVDQKEYIPMNELIRRVLNNEIKIENPERLYAYAWNPEDERMYIGFEGLSVM